MPIIKKKPFTHTKCPCRGLASKHRNASKAFYIVLPKTSWPLHNELHNTPRVGLRK